MTQAEVRAYQKQKKESLQGNLTTQAVKELQSATKHVHVQFDFPHFSPESRAQYDEILSISTQIEYENLLALRGKLSDSEVLSNLEAEVGIRRVINETSRVIGGLVSVAHKIGNYTPPTVNEDKEIIVITKYEVVE